MFKRCQQLTICIGCYGISFELNLQIIEIFFQVILGVPKQQEAKICFENNSKVCVPHVACMPSLPPSSSPITSSLISLVKDESLSSGTACSSLIKQHF